MPNYEQWFIFYIFSLIIIEFLFYMLVPTVAIIPVSYTHLGRISVKKTSENLIMYKLNNSEEEISEEGRKKREEMCIRDRCWCSRGAVVINNAKKGR